MNRDSAFVESVFDAKAKRTAMEAEEYFTVPQLDEIETPVQEVQTTAGATAPAERPAEKKPYRSHARRSPVAERKEKEEKRAAIAKAQSEPTANKQKPAPTKEAPKKTAQQPKEKKTEANTPKRKPATPKSTEVSAEVKEEKQEQKPAKRKPRPKRPQMTEEEKAALQTQREEQIRAAEEAAYAELSN